MQTLSVNGKPVANLPRREGFHSSHATLPLTRIVHGCPANTVILSAAKNLERLGNIEILRCAQDDECLAGP